MSPALDPTATASSSSSAAPDLRVLVLAGGLSYERDVSLKSGRRVLDALRSVGVEAEMRDADVSLIPALRSDPPDAVVIALHGATGEDGSLRGVLDLCGVPYIGCDARAARLAWDKPSAKAVLREAGIPTPDWVALPHDRFSELGAVAVLERIVERLGLPLMVKPAQGGSGLGAAVVREVAELSAAMVGCFAYDSTALVERYVTGMDVAVSVVDRGDSPEALPAVEIVPRNGVYDYAARYTAGLTTWHAPARLAEPAAERVAATAVAAHRALGLRDLSRVDMIVDADGRPHVLEVNVSPGMTETSLLPLAVQAGGLDLGELLATLVVRAAARPYDPAN
ncbi:MULTISPECIES: D-alanine--D-alanine ligase [unclassified Solwaraspora]|uniref:D-alanine--D-alanine ligase family protein n=1 Tax=unclassified Solwaraspora TaxID=2627926 RepID=UPI00248C00AD|nr:MULTISPECIES: D-alanine--D-alanine ligase [unclassified Solwaraspora]WBB96846.1 D-alanine--D-alanine ligase [Solwaraspora sp. WMMA2059]WBC19249.1 D-alanine--D-alanine ligase [Solwaraspora sp. WMMA2080]WJK33307.1 D-alanine--D-alanine ligase [Solwaraspora sp. WMMA2065]